MLECPNIPTIPQLFSLYRDIHGCESFVQQQLLNKAWGWLEAGIGRGLPAAWLRWSSWCWLLLQRPALKGPTPATQAVSHSMQKVHVSEILT